MVAEAIVERVIGANGCILKPIGIRRLSPSVRLRAVAQRLQVLLEEAVELAERAGTLTLSYFDKPDLRVDAKPDGTEVTNADRGAESLIRDHILEHYPHDSILGEEHGTVDGSSGRTWIVDPIDGTFGFVRGVPLYSTLIAVVDEVGPAVGVIHLPALSQTVGAARGEGCWFDSTRCSVGGRATVDGALICSSDWGAASDQQLLSLKHAGAHMRTWGDAYGYAMVAAGKAEAMVDPICSTWDLAPIPVIIHEAGGTFSSLEGDPGFDRGNGVATNGVIHDELLGLIGFR